MLKKNIFLATIFILLVSCSFMDSSKDSYNNDLWDRYNKKNTSNLWDEYSKKTTTSEKLHAKLVEVHNRDSLAFTYSPYRADFKDRLF